ncbi:MAG: class I SAM-dependent methyltransferase, partial [Acidimicrobiales bacterium]
MATDQYETIAIDYEWYFDDVAQLLGSDTPGVRSIIGGLAPGALVLDAACGVGVDAAALAHRGFEVTAADASPAMVAQARRRLDRVGSEDPIRVVTSAWTELPTHLGNAVYDLVLCVGNSIAHADGSPAMIAAFKAFRSLLVPGGRLVLDTIDWERAHGEGSRIEIEPRVVERRGSRCVRTYAWHVAPRFGDPWELEIAPILLRDDRATLRSHRVVLHPFTRRQLRDRLAVAGFEAIAL